MKITIEERMLHFKQPAGTSRGIYTTRKIWLVKVTDSAVVGVGECAPLPQLSCDDIPNYGEVLRHFCDEVEQTGKIPYEALRDYPSMLFGLETAFTNFDTAFSRGEVGIPINGLIWMGSFEEMNQRIEQKLEQGFRCVKLKIGAIDFDAELELIKNIRSRYSHHEVELRVDANGMRLCINWNCCRNMHYTPSSNLSKQDSGAIWQNCVVSHPSPSHWTKS